MAAAAGVYAVEHEDDQVYIGKTGKVVPTREGSVQLNSGRLSGRLARSTPYCFQKKGAYAGFFEYDPNFSVNELSKQEYESRYRVHIPISKIAVHCFNAARSCSEGSTRGGGDSIINLLYGEVWALATCKPGVVILTMR